MQAQHASAVCTAFSAQLVQLYPTQHVTAVSQCLQSSKTCNKLPHCDSRLQVEMGKVSVANGMHCKWAAARGMRQWLHYTINALSAWCAARAPQSFVADFEKGSS